MSLFLDRLQRLNRAYEESSITIPECSSRFLYYMQYATEQIQQAFETLHPDIQEQVISIASMPDEKYFLHVWKTPATNPPVPWLERVVINSSDPIRIELVYNDEGKYIREYFDKNHPAVLAIRVLRDYIENKTQD